MNMRETFVIKCGGSTLAALPESFYMEMRQLQQDGYAPVIVHGGGPAINEMLDKLGIETTFVNGLRQTSEAVLDVVEMVLAGQINKQIVRKVQLTGADAIGLSGTDGGLIKAVPVANAHEVGLVGDVVSVNGELLAKLAGLGVIPVIAPIGLGEDGRQRYNINADTAAGAVAAHLGVSRLIVVTDVPGILHTGADGSKQLLPVVTTSQVQEMIASGEIYGGMIPKVKAAAASLKGGVREVVIVDGAAPGVLTKAVKGEPVGTRIVEG